MHCAKTTLYGQDASINQTIKTSEMRGSLSMTGISERVVRVEVIAYIKCIVAVSISRGRLWLTRPSICTSTPADEHIPIFHDIYSSLLETIPNLVQQTISLMESNLKRIKTGRILIRIRIWNSSITATTLTKCQSKPNPTKMWRHKGKQSKSIPIAGTPRKTIADFIGHTHTIQQKTHV